MPKYFSSHLLIAKNKKDNTFDYNLKVSFFSDVNTLNSNRYHLYNMMGLLISDNGKKPIKQNSHSSTTSKITCIHWGYYITNNETVQDWLVDDWWECDSGSDDNEQAPPNGSGDSGSSNGSDVLLEDTEVIEDYINDTNLDPCTKDILNKLKNLGGGDIAEMLKRFSPAGTIFILNMRTGQVTVPRDWAQTSKDNSSGTSINMVFNEDYINGKDNPSRPTDLSVATTMVHEIIHAYLISLLEENKICGASVICDFPTIYDAYVQQQIAKDKNNTLSQDAHHELIAQNYVNSIAATIQEFHTGLPINSGIPKQVYLDMAWGGLTGTRIFNKNYPNDPNDKNYKDRERITARINTEKLGSQYGINSPVGTPCKK